MGKIRTKIIGLEEVEKKQAKEAKVRREAKKIQKKTSVKAESIIEEKIISPDMPAEEKPEKKPTTKKTAKAKIKTKSRGQRYFSASKLVDKKKQYSAIEAVTLLKKMAHSRFDETVELHLNVKEAGLKGEVSLPHGTGKQSKVAILTDEVIKLIEQGKIDFDVLIARPTDMPKLVKFAKVLGPKGLMPNPKAGTVSEKPEEAVKKFTSGVIRFKTEAKFPLLHQSIGKLSFRDEQLVDNIAVFLKAVKPQNITTVYLKSTMSPAIKINTE